MLNPGKGKLRELRLRSRWVEEAEQPESPPCALSEAGPGGLGKPERS